MAERWCWCSGGAVMPEALPAPRADEAALCLLPQGCHVPKPLPVVGASQHPHPSLTPSTALPRTLGGRILPPPWLPPAALTQGHARLRTGRPCLHGGQQLLHTAFSSPFFSDGPHSPGGEERPDAAGGCRGADPPPPGTDTAPVPPRVCSWGARGSPARAHPANSSRHPAQLSFPSRRLAALQGTCQATVQSPSSSLFCTAAAAADDAQL